MVTNLGTAFAVTGFVAPAATGQFETGGRLLIGLLWLTIGAGLHGIALTILGELK